MVQQRKSSSSLHKSLREGHFHNAAAFQQRALQAAGSYVKAFSCYDASCIFMQLIGQVLGRKVYRTVRVSFLSFRAMTFWDAQAATDFFFKVYVWTRSDNRRSGVNDKHIDVYVCCASEVERQSESEQLCGHWGSGVVISC